MTNTEAISKLEDEVAMLYLKMIQLSAMDSEDEEAVELLRHLFSERIKATERQLAYKKRSI